MLEYSNLLHTRKKHDKLKLRDKYPASEPCSCEICTSYCLRPGWWTVREAVNVIKAGYAHRMMLEISPEHTFGVLSPAFKGCENFFAVNEYAHNGCTFFVNNLCQLYTTGLIPLECKFCHHSRKGMGLLCHADIEKDWNTRVGKELVLFWMKSTGLWKIRHFCQIEWMT